jgi:hypothetical protein
VLAAAALSRLALEAITVDFVTDGQRTLWSWPFFGFFVACYAVAAVAATRAKLPSPAGTLAQWPTGLALPAATGFVVALLTIASDVAEPAAAARGVASVHVTGPAAVPFYAYGAALLSTVFHFLPVALLAWAAARLGGRARALLVGAGIAIVAFSEDFGYFARQAPDFGIEWFRHALSVAANGAEAVFIYRFGLLAGLAQRASTYLVWHLGWPSWAPS